MVYSEKLCDEKHKTIDEKLNDHEQRLNSHSQKIDNLENHESAVTVQIEKLCQSMKDLVSAIRWGLGLFITVVGLAVSIIAVLSK